MDKITTALDISAYNGTLNPAQINAGGVILRAGYTGYGSAHNIGKDKNFETYYKQLSAAGVPIGVYYFTLAYNSDMVKKETDWLKNLLAGRSFLYPIFIDVEGQSRCSEWTNLSKTARTALVKEWLQIMQAAGYYVGVYASKSWLGSQLIPSELASFDVWVAQYYSRCTYTGNYGMWQYSSSEPGSSHGLSGSRVDISEVYKDYPTIIRSKGLNNTTTAPAVDPDPAYTLENFRSDVFSILGVSTGSAAVAKAPTISAKVNRSSALVTPLERYLGSLGYYTGAIEADAGKSPIFGAGMTAAVKIYQRDVVKAAAKYQDGVISHAGATWRKLLL